MPSTKKIEPKRQLVKRPWTQANGGQDVEFRSLTGTQIGLMRKHPEMDQAHLKVIQEVVDAQRQEAAGAQKRARTTWPPKDARKKSPGDCAQDDALKDSGGIHARGKGHAGRSSTKGAAEAVPSTASIDDPSAVACIALGQGEISAIKLRKYLDTQSNPFRIDQPSMKSSPTTPEQDCSPTLAHAKTPPNSPQIENSLPSPHESKRGSSSNQETTHKVPEVLSTTENLGEGRKEFQNGTAKLTEIFSAKTTKPLLPQPSMVPHPGLTMDICPPSGQPENKNESGAPVFALRRLPVRDLLNETGGAEDLKPLEPTTINTISGGRPAPDTGLEKLQGEMPAGLQPAFKYSTTLRRILPKIAAQPQTSPWYAATNASELALVRALDHKSTSGPSRDGASLEWRVIARKLAVTGKILIPKSDEPGAMVTLSIDPLLSQNAPDFFHFYSQTAGAKSVAVLSFGLPDVSWQRPQTRTISRSDSHAFCTLQQTIWDSFCDFLTTRPSTAVFRVLVTAPARDVADATIQTLPSASQVSVTATRTSSYERFAAIRSQPTLGSTEVSAPGPRKYSTEGFPAAPTRPRSRELMRLSLPALKIPLAPQHDRSLVLRPAAAYTQYKPVDETPQSLQFVVRIQENEHCRFSRAHSRNFLRSEVTTKDFFAWFARCTGHDYPCGPPELKFTWKDALSNPKHAKIKRGDEENFQFMKGDIKSQFERTKVLVPELIEFAVLVTVPGWVVEHVRE